MVKHTKFKGQENSGTALNLIEITAQIINSTFLSNRKGLYKKCFIFNPLYGCVRDRFIGGAITATNSTVDISRSKFEDNRADAGGAIYRLKGGRLHASGSSIKATSSIILDFIVFIICTMVQE